MKIRYISNARMPTEKAHGIQIVQMARAFVEAGATVELVLPKRRNAIESDLFTYYGIPQIFHVRKLPAIDLGVGGIFGTLAFILLQWSFALQALRDARKNPADLYYVRDELVFRTLARGGISCVYEAHTIPRRFFFYRKAFLSATRIVTISHGLSDELVRLGVPQKNILVAPDGVRLRDFAKLPERTLAREGLGMSPSECVVLYTGQLFPWKGVDVLMEAFREGMPPSIRLLVVGGGAGRLEELKEKLAGSGARIAFVGQVPHEEISRYLSASDIVVIPNSGKEQISRLYTSPLKLFEALAAGKPIIASDLPSLREVLDETTAIFTPPDDSSALRASIIRLAEDVRLRGELSESAKKHALSYDWTLRARNILSAFPS